MNRPPNGDWHSADPLAARIRAEHRRNDRWALRLQIGVLGTCGGMFIIAAYRAAPAIVVAPMQYSQILWASTLALIFFAEVPKPATLGGIAVIVGAGLLQLWSNSRAPAYGKSLA